MYYSEKNEVKNKKKWKYLIILSFICCASHSKISHQKRLNQTFFDYHYIIGELSSLKGQRAEAVSYFKKGGMDHYIRLRLAQEYMWQGLDHRAEKEILQIIGYLKDEHSLISAHLLLSEIYTSMNILDRAIDHYGKVLKMDSRHPTALLNQSLLLARANRSISLKNFQILNKNPQFHFYMGDIYLLKGDEVQSIESFKKALSLDPAHRGSALRLFQIYSQKGLYKNWTHFMERHISDDMYIRVLTAQAYLRQGKRTEILEDLLWDHPLVWGLRAELEAFHR